MGTDADHEWPAPRVADVASALLERRVVLVSGEVGAARASELGATLMMLDATGDGRVELRLSSCGGPLGVALALVDVLDVLGVPVHATALGTIEGGPVGVLAACEVRRVAPHATLALREPDVEVAGTARDLERAIAAQAAERMAFLGFLARRVRRPVGEVEQEWGRGALLEAADAVALGYADAILDDAAQRRDRDASAAASDGTEP